MQDGKTFLGTQPIKKLLPKLAVPTVIAQLVNMLYNIVDRIYIGHIPEVGSLALTGIGVCMPLILIVSAFSAFVASGGAPRASIFMGRGDCDSAERTLGGCLTMQVIISLLLISVPTFVTGFLAQYFLGVKLRLLPVTAGASPGFIDLLMPAIVLGSVSMAYIIRLSRSEISSNIALDYVRTARAKGMSNRSVMNRHVLRNSMIPVVTYLGQDLGALMGGAMISETIFNVHGIGYLTYQSILKGEGNLVVSIVTLLMLIFAVCNLLVDMLYAALDPRIRYA